MTVRLKYIVALILFSLIVACGEGLQQKADMYEASELSKMMRDMVTWSKQAKHKLQNGGTIQHVPKAFYDMKNQVATRGEHKEAAFLGMVPTYINALKGIERKDSQQYYYDASIRACKTCHSVYCDGPMQIINQL